MTSCVLSRSQLWSCKLPHNLWDVFSQMLSSMGFRRGWILLSLKTTLKEKIRIFHGKILAPQILRHGFEMAAMCHGIPVMQFWLLLTFWLLLRTSAGFLGIEDCELCHFQFACLKAMNITCRHVSQELNLEDESSEK